MMVTGRGVQLLRAELRHVSENKHFASETKVLQAIKLNHCTLRLPRISAECMHRIVFILNHLMLRNFAKTSRCTCLPIHFYMPPAPTCLGGTTYSPYMSRRHIPMLLHVSETPPLSLHILEINPYAHTSQRRYLCPYMSQRHTLSPLHVSETHPMPLQLMPRKSGELGNLVPEIFSHLERNFSVPNKEMHKK